MGNKSNSVETRGKIEMAGSGDKADVTEFSAFFLSFSFFSLSLFYLLSCSSCLPFSPILISLTFSFLHSYKLYQGYLE